MIWISRLLFFLAGTFLTIAILFLGLTLYGWDKVWERVAGPADMGPVTFQGLAKGPKPNQALICPQGLCHPDHVDQISPIYGVRAEELAKILQESLALERNLVRVDDQSDPLQLRFVQRTSLLKYPDTVRVLIKPVDTESSTIALYSQSQVGRSDFGVNLARMQRWLSRLAPYENPNS